MEFCCKFYRSTEFKVVLIGLLLSLSALNAVDDDCYYSQNLQDGQIYYVYNHEYPYMYEGESHCLWEMRNPSVTKLNCTTEMDYQDTLFVEFADGSTDLYSGYKTFVIQGTNPTIRFDSQRNSKGRFLCEINTLNANNCQCGWKKVTRIVGGEETGINEYPMMCGLVDSINKDVYSGCTIISSNYVVTAAHCVYGRDPNSIGVLVGGHDLKQMNKTHATKLFRVDEYMIHAYYQRKEIPDHDIAICKIFGSIKFSPEVGPVCLPFRHKEDSFDNCKVTALGWGTLEFGGARATALQKVELDVVPCQDQNYFKESNRSISNNNICTYTSGKDTCQMDSGGPLLWTDPDTCKLTLVGIISSGFGCASNNPAFGTRVGKYISWIQSVTPDAQYCQVE